MPGAPAVFIDRDGTLIQERAYLADPGGVVLIQGAIDALRALLDAGWRYAIVTNQSGIARGLYTEADYHGVAARLQAILEEAGVPPAATAYCPHHPDITGPCACRKPATGMYRRMAEQAGLELAGCYCVGDKITDVLPARELGGHGLLVRTGYGRDQEAAAPPDVMVVDDLGAAVRHVLEHAGRR